MLVPLFFSWLTETNGSSLPGLANGDETLQRGGEMVYRYWNSFKDKGIFSCLRLLVSTAELLRDIHGCPASKKVKAPWIRVHTGNKAKAVMALYHYNNNKFFHGEAVRGINKVLSINTPTSHAMQTKLIIRLWWGVFFMFNLTLICCWHCNLNIWQCNYSIRFRPDMQPLSPLSSYSFLIRDNVITSTVAAAVKLVRKE